MNYKLFMISIILIGFLIVSGCTSNTSQSTQSEQNPSVERSSDKHIKLIWSDYITTNSYDNYGIDKIRIEEDNITCYIYENYDEAGGLSCFRDN